MQAQVHYRYIFIMVNLYTRRFWLNNILKCICTIISKNSTGIITTTVHNTERKRTECSIIIRTIMSLKIMSIGILILKIYSPTNCNIASIFFLNDNKTISNLMSIGCAAMFMLPWMTFSLFIMMILLTSNGHLITNIIITEKSRNNCNIKMLW